MRDKSELSSHVTVDQVAWTSAPHYPEALKRVVRWNTLIGGAQDGFAGVPEKDVRMGVLELQPGGFYPAHAHPAPEIYYVMGGRAEWTVGNETFIAQPGMAVYHAPNVLHRMVNTGTELLRTVWFWWAPDGRGDVLQADIDLLEPMPQALALRDAPT